MADTYKTFRSKQFRYDGARKTFSAEASSLGLPPGEWPLGFYLRSARTGVAVFFRIKETVREQETGERGGSDLICCDYSANVAKVGPAIVVTVRIYND